MNSTLYRIIYVILFSNIIIIVFFYRRANRNVLGTNYDGRPTHLSKNKK